MKLSKSKNANHTQAYGLDDPATDLCLFRSVRAKHARPMLKIPIGMYSVGLSSI